MESKSICASNTLTGKVQRSSNLELFRIITMFMIVIHHYVVNSGLTDAGGVIYSDPTSWRSIFLLTIGAFGKTGINCFVLISGYFMCKSEITLKKFLKLLLELEFYKILFWLIFTITGYESFSITGFVKAVLPVTGITTGFTSCYIVFFLFIPFLNILIHNMNEKHHILLIALSSFMYIVLGTMPGFGVAMNYVSWFVVLYFIASYIRLYDKPIFNNTKFWAASTITMLVLSAASVVGFILIGKADKVHYLLSDSNKIFAVLLGISAFMFFKNLKMKNSRFINTVAASSFGVLLIHANSDAMRRWLWKDVLDNVGMYDSKFMVLHLLGSVLAIYILCTVIDYLRIRFIEKPFFKVIDKRFSK